MEHSGRMVPRPRRSRQKHKSARPPEAATFPWRKLPSLVRHMILKELAGDDEGGLAQGGVVERRAAYATVCSEWQAFFEEKCFRKLVLHASDLSGFERIVKRRAGGRKSSNSAGMRTRGKSAAEASASALSRMPPIQHIWLRIELLRYQCPDCIRCQFPIEVIRNNVLFTKALWKLLEILSAWEKMDANHGQKLTLELSAHSPSDSEHMLMRDAEDQDDYPHRAGIAAQRDYMERYNSDATRLNTNSYYSFLHNINAHNLDDPVNVAINGGPPDPVHDQGPSERLISILDFDFFGIRLRPGQSARRLPEVKMVSSFLMRRQFYRSINNYALRRLMTESLTGVRELRYERWRLTDPKYQEMADWSYGLTLNSPTGAGSILGPAVPSPLETLSLFEDFGDKLHRADDVDEPRPSRIKILQWVAHTAPNIRHLSVAFVSDAKDCLELAAHTFPRLESLALTSQHWLEPTQEHTTGLMLLAARAAARMPMLQIMEVWTCRDGHAAVLRYEGTGTPGSSASRLTWRCSWDPGRAAARPVAWTRVIAAWRHVAATVALRELRVATDPLPPGPGRYASYGGVLHQLKLRNLILDPASVMQVRVGAGAGHEAEVEAWRPSVPDSYWSRGSKGW